MNLPRFDRRAVAKSIPPIVAFLALAMLFLSTIGRAQDGSPDEQSSGSVLQGGVSNDGASGGVGGGFSSGGGGDNTGGGGDVFSSGGNPDGGGPDTFSSGGNPDGGGPDTFSSGGTPDDGGPDVYNSNGGVPYAYPTPPPRFPCGPNAIENQAWGGPFASGFLSMLAPIVTQACPKMYVPRRRRAQQTRPSGPPVFIYYYINGMNTPVSKIYDRNNPDYFGNWRGSCITEHDTFKQNVLGQTVQSPDIPRPSISGSIKVGNEIDVMYPPTCNVSGKDPWGGDWYTQNCTGRNVNTAWMAKALCSLLKTPNGFRGGDAILGGSISPTDLFECVWQSSFAKSPVPFAPSGIDYTTNQEVVNKIVNSMRSIYSKELQSGSTQRHYFIVTGHSQGNFFVEGVAYKLYTSDALGQQIFQNRLALISLGSPTSYTTLPANWVASKLKHHTRKDDGINLLLVANAMLKSSNQTPLFKVPWPLEGDDAPLWNWSVDPATEFFSLNSHLIPPEVNSRAKLAATILLQPTDSLVNQYRAIYLLSYDFFLMGAAPPQGPSPYSIKNPELYSPLLNSHLVENYLCDPAATKPGVPVSNKLAKVLHPLTSPAVPPLLQQIMTDVKSLKTTLLQQSGTTLQAKNP
jgi:hypothetical protein